VTAPICFHLAFPVKDLAATREFYTGLLGCSEGRSAPDWVDFDFFGHQISAHWMPSACRASDAHDVDGDQVPVRHFGLVLDWDDWHRLVERLKSLEPRFLIAPHVRFQGLIGEQATLFLIDPSGNALEFKAFRDPARVFAR
jgi:uncharacterized protein